jgi:hypothetical protein
VALKLKRDRADKESGFQVTVLLICPLVVEALSNEMSQTGSRKRKEENSWVNPTY